MDERIKAFINELSRQLEGLPGEEAAEALRYYTEYLADAEEAGKDLDKVMKNLGSPAKIAAAVKAEASMQKAHDKPGLKSFASALRSALSATWASFAYFLVLLIALLSFSVAAVLFAGAGVFFIAAVAAFAGMVYEALMLHKEYTAEIIGTLGMGLFSGSLIFLVAFGFYRLAGIWVKLTLRVLKGIVKKPAAQSVQP